MGGGIGPPSPITLQLAAPGMVATEVSGTSVKPFGCLSQVSALGLNGYADCSFSSGLIDLLETRAECNRIFDGPPQAFIGPCAADSFHCGPIFLWNVSYSNGTGSDMSVCHSLYKLSKFSDVTRVFPGQKVFTDSSIDLRHIVTENSGKKVTRKQWDIFLTLAQWHGTKDTACDAVVQIQAELTAPYQLL